MLVLHITYFILFIIADDVVEDDIDNMCSSKTRHQVSTFDYDSQFSTINRSSSSSLSNRSESLLEPRNISHFQTSSLNARYNVPKILPGEYCSL